MTALTDFSDVPFKLPPDGCVCCGKPTKGFAARVEGDAYCRKCFQAWRKQQTRGPRGTKHNNHRFKDEYGSWDSKAERARYGELMLLEQVGAISHLKRQVPFSFDYDGVHIGKYFADFTYFRKDRRVVEDVNGHRTSMYARNKRLMLAFYKIAIEEVKAR